MTYHSPPRKEDNDLRRNKTKANFFRAFESGPNQRWEVARAVVSCAKIFSLSCSYPGYPLKTIVSAVSCLTGLEVSLRRAPKNYPEGNFLEASRANVELTVVISWSRKILPEHLEHSQAIYHSKQIPKFANCILLSSHMKHLHFWKVPKTSNNEEQQLKSSNRKTKI